MNAYDFDKTIFYPDSSYTFAIWSLKRHPLAFLRSFPSVVWYSLLYFLKIVHRDTFKMALFRYLRYIPNIDSEVTQFWDKHEGRIAKWYLNQRRDDDLIISASPEFLINEIGARLGVSVIATRMDKNTGEIFGKNCHNAEKVRRFYEVFPNGKVNNFYSDSFVDTPMAEIADNAYIIVDKGQRPIPWPERK